MDKIADRELGGQDHARHAAVGFCVQRDHAPFPHVRPLVGTEPVAERPVPARHHEKHRRRQ